MHFKIPLTCLLLVILAPTGCEVDGRFEKPINVQDITTLNGGLVIHDTGHSRLMYLEPKQDMVRVSEFFRATDEESLDWFAVGPNPSAPTEFYQMVLPVDERNPDITETLHRFAFDDGGEPVATSYDLNSPFSTMVFGPAGRFAVLYHSEDGDGDFDIFNPNEVAIVDLSAAPGESNPSFDSVDLNGHRISSVMFLEPLSIGAVTRQFVVFVASRVIRIMDLLDPLATARIPLVTDNDPRDVVPAQVIARDGDEVRNTKIFIRATNSQDIYEITVSPKPNGESGFLATMNQFEILGTPLDMVHVQDGEDPLLVVLSKGDATQSQRSIFNVVDIDTSSPFTIMTDDKTKSLLKRQIDTGEQVVAYGDQTDLVSFLEVDGVLEERYHNLEDVEIPGGIAHSLLLDPNRLLILSDRLQDIILLDLDTQKSTRFSAPALVYDDWVTSKIHNDWFYFVPGSGDRIGYVDLVTDHPDSLLLDDSLDSFHIVKQSNMGVCIHPNVTGRVTLFPLDNPTRSGAFVVDGLWISNFLGGKEAN